MTKEFVEKAIKNPKKSALIPSVREAPMVNLEKTAKIGAITHMDNISKMMSDLYTTHKSMKLNLNKIRA